MVEERTDGAVLEEVVSMMPADEIDGSFAPRLRSGVASVQVDGESVLLLEGTDRVHWLDQLGTIVLGCFDGSTKLDELCTDLSEAFGADRDIVAKDLLEMARAVGRAGLLEGVAEEEPQHQAGAPRGGLKTGTEIPPFTLPTPAGNSVNFEDLLGRRVLLVNWSPHCGYCRGIAPDLAELRPRLAHEGVELVLLTFGTAEENLQLAEEHGLEATILLQEDRTPDFFAGIGTPAAYLVDEEGKTASQLSLGANQVPELARSLAGLAGGTDQPE